MLIREQHLYKSPAIDISFCVWSPQITIALTEGALSIFFQSAVKKLLAWPGIEPTTQSRKE